MSCNKIHFFVLIYCLLIIDNCKGDKIFSDSLFMELNQNHHDTIKIDILLQLGEAQNISINERLQLTYKALEISKRNNYQKGIGMSYHLIIRHQQLDQDEMEVFGNGAIGIFNEIGDFNFVGKTLHAISSYYLFKGGNYLKSIEYAQRNIDYCREKGLTLDSYRSWNLIGEIYRLTKNYEKAIEFYENAIKASNNPNYLAPHINIGTIYKNQGKFLKAKDKFETILDSLENTGRIKSQGYAYVQNRLGQVFISLKEYNKAEKVLKASLLLYTQLNMNQGKVLVNSSLSMLYSKVGKFNSSIKFGEKAIALALDINYISEGIEEISLLTAQNYEKLNDFKKAYQYNSIHNALLDSLFGPKKNVAMVYKQIKLENEKQYLQNQLLQKQIELDKAMIIRQYIQNSVVIAVVIFLIIITIYLNRNYKIKNNLFKVLTEQREEILRQAEELEKTNSKIQNMNTNLENEVSERTIELENELNKVTKYAFMNAHHLRGPLAKILGVIYLMDMEINLENKNTYLEKLKSASGELDNVIENINDLLNDN